MKRPQLNVKNALIAILAWSLIGPAMASEDDLYDFLWLDPDKKVYVLQNKVYKKKGKAYANIGFSFSLNDNYQDTTGIQFSTGYYLGEEWAVELLYHQYSNSDSDNFQSLRTINGSIPFIRKVNSKYGALGIWSPFYGKINTFNKIIYFDWSFGLGVGQIKTESNATTVANSSTADIYEDESAMAVLGKTALRIHANQNWHVGIEYHRDHYQAPGATVNGNVGADKWRSNSELVFSIGFSF